jgi:hypothetical protein
MDKLCPDFPLLVEHHRKLPTVLAWWFGNWYNVWCVLVLVALGLWFLIYGRR